MNGNTDENQGLSREALLGEYLKPDSITKIFTIASLLFGGFIFIVYFTHIGFMPEMDLQSSLLLIIVASIVGGICFLSLFFFLVFPGILWSYGVLKNDDLKDLWSETDKEKSAKELRHWFLLSFGFFLSFLFLLLFLGRFSQLFVRPLPGAVLLIISAFIVRLFLIKNRLPDQGIKKILVKSLIFSWIDCLAYSGTIISWLILYLALVDQATKAEINDFIFSTVLIAIFSILSNLLVLGFPIYLKEAPRTYGVAFCFLIALLLIFNFAAVPEAVMRTYGWGGLYQASIIVNNKGCNSLQNYGAKINQPCSNENSFYKFDNIDILSAIGKEWYLRLHDKSSTPPFTLPRDTVVSYSKNIKNQ